MAVQTDLRPAKDRPRPRQRMRQVRIFFIRLGRTLATAVFSSLTRRIVILNLFALIALLSGILYLNQFRAGLIDARLESLMTQGEIIAAAIASSATVDTNTIRIDPDEFLRREAVKPDAPADEAPSALEFPIDPEQVAPVLRRLISPTRTRARIYDRDGFLVLDSRALYRRGDLAAAERASEVAAEPTLLDRMLQMVPAWLKGGELPLYREYGPSEGKNYPEVEQSLTGAAASIVRLSAKAELIVSIAVPIQRQRTLLGSLMLSTQGGDIDAIVRAERLAMIRVFLVAAGVTILLSIILAGTIAGPMRRLSAAADRVRRSVKAREEIPDFSDREDEIGHLSRALRDMTNALYARLEAIENFAADVAHELKNPLTSLRSAVETLPLARTEKSKARLLEIIQHDVRRLDRLISDISDASRLDAELAREDATAVDVKRLLEAVVGLQNELAKKRGQGVALKVVADAKATAGFVVPGHESRLGQVFTNLIDNARSFSPDTGTVSVRLKHDGDAIEIVVDDDGPGIGAENIERIFERFYTDRPDGEAFGNNSGLGLAITRQIVEAHRGTIQAENRISAAPEPVIEGARFTVRLPAR